MRQTVLAAWPAFITAREGKVAHMYRDTKGYATFGIGRKIDDAGEISEYGLTRPWRDSDEQLVTEAEIAAEFSRIKKHAELDAKGGRAFAGVARLHLDDRDIDEALFDTTGTFWAILRRTLPDAESWPASAQLALLDMAYNLGPAFLGDRWPKFTRSARAGDFAGCAAECHTAARTKRDADRAALFRVAAAVTFAGLDPSPVLHDPPRVLAELPRTALSFTAWTELPAAELAGIGSRPNVAAWYVQRMLAAAGAYDAAAIDGEFGPQSRAALAAWAGKARQQPALNRVSVAALSAATLKMPVTG